MSEQRLDEIHTLAKKALDCIEHASDAIAHRSPIRFGVEIRMTMEQLDRIIELSDTAAIPHAERITSTQEIRDALGLKE
jgi:hypothetical protein